MVCNINTKEYLSIYRQEFWRRKSNGLLFRPDTGSKIEHVYVIQSNKLVCQSELVCGCRKFTGIEKLCNKIYLE